MEKNKDITLIMTACAAYADLIEINITLMKKYWPDCNLKKICVVDTINDEIKKIAGFFDLLIEVPQSIAGKNLLRVRKALELIDTPYVMMVQDDFFLCDFVRNERLEQVLNFAKQHNAGTVALLYKYEKHKKASRVQSNIEFRKCSADEVYRISMQNIFWKTTYLKALVDRYESPADFERQGSGASSVLVENVYCLRNGHEIYPSVDAINRGKWRLGVTAFLKEQGIDYDSQKRPELSVMDKLVSRLRSRLFLISPKLVTAIVNKIPWRKSY